MRSVFLWFFLVLASSSAAFACDARIVRSETSVVLADNDCAVAFLGSVPAARHVTLPPNPVNGKLVELSDIGAGFSQHPLNVTPNKGQHISDFPGHVPLNWNGAVWRFRFFRTSSAGGIWNFSIQ
jgi:hypothetical protein